VGFRDGRKEGEFEGRTEMEGTAEGKNDVDGAGDDVGLAVLMQSMSILDGS